MAEAIGIASGLVALATLAFDCSISLIKTVREYQSHPAAVRSLLEELEALSVVLRSLAETCKTVTDVDLSALDLPLKRCAHACQEFQQALTEVSKRSGDNRTNFKGWAKIKYMGGDINAFKDLLARYKSTITVAINDAHLRLSSTTAEELKKLRELVRNATVDLEDHRRNLDDRFEAIFEHSVPGSDADAADLQLIKEERLSAQRCLDICAQLSDHISQIQLSPTADSRSTWGSFGQGPSPQRIINQGLQDCRDNLRLTRTKLEKCEQELVDQLVARLRTTMSSEEEATDLARLREEWAATHRNIEILLEADSHMKADISIIENHATGDETRQIMVSTYGKTLYGTNRGTGVKTLQVGGHVSDVTVQALSRDFSGANVQTVDNDPLPEDNAPSNPKEAAGDEPSPEYRDRFGRGFSLALNPDATSKQSAQGEQTGPKR